MTNIFSTYMLYYFLYINHTYYSLLFYWMSLYLVLVVFLHVMFSFSNAFVLSLRVKNMTIPYSVNDLFNGLFLYSSKIVYGLYFYA